jgi:hypothetical protein
MCSIHGTENAQTSVLFVQLMAEHHFFKRMRMAIGITISFLFPNVRRYDVFMLDVKMSSFLGLDRRLSGGCEEIIAIYGFQNAPFFSAAEYLF